MVPTVVPNNPIGWTQTYLLESSDGPYLVDTGWNHDDAWADLVSGLVACGTSVEEVRGVLVTHHHPDHLGLVGRVRDASGCWVGMHDADTDLVRRHRAILSDDPEVFEKDTAEKLLEAGGRPGDGDQVDRRPRDGHKAVPQAP